MSEQRESDRQLKAFWDQSREYYELAIETNPEAASERQELFAHLRGGELILDLGCGACDNAVWLPKSCRYVGTDVSTAGLALARELDRQAQTVRADAQRLPFADQSFDAVLSTWAIEHFHEPARTLLEVIRVLKPGGLMLLVGSAWDLPHSLPPSLDPRRRRTLAFKRLGHQLRSLLDRRHRFEIVAEPRALSEEYVPDADAVHVTQSYLVRRFLEASGLEILVQRSLTHNQNPSSLKRLVRAVIRVVPLWRHAWGNTLFVARKGKTTTRPPYDLLRL